ncbi:hypothetical protein BV509_00945 [Rhodovulum sulfidophilum]|uniref:Three-Cys-motif partner protein TcmP n=1 Tax=Rhodovulum visakhapatnamense TaxID=364297 RepID=A0ABS1RFU6_9RHOB|nr:three-Cys-motif partner protein TcmP [Rhodovulum visakhapatnamense]MBL3578405.1 three-Cys-motif partner protein TcmP [Rhodovulum visakhapatnamense]OLS43055.1 hypothetical protein BV509_00945 [Rhodovulum sulfidophilum]
MTDPYDGRPQSWAKHEILKRYLGPFSQKVVRGLKNLQTPIDELVFVDGFAGPWDTATDDCSDSSFMIAIAELRRAHDALNASGLGIRTRVHLNEANRKAYRRLVDLVAESSDHASGFRVETTNLPFDELAAQIGPANASEFRLVFIDPKGWSGYPLACLRKLGRENTELLINFMRYHVHRFVKSSAEGETEGEDRQFSALLGEDWRDRIGTSPSGIAARDLLRERLRKDIGFRFAPVMEIGMAQREQVHFDLILATRSTVAVDLARAIEKKVMEDYEKRRIPSSQMDLFEGDPDYARDWFIRRRRDAQASFYKKLQETVDGRRRSNEFKSVCADIQEDMPLTKSAITLLLVHLADNGAVEATWKERGAKRPGDFDPVILVQNPCTPDGQSSLF